MTKYNSDDEICEKDYNDHYLHGKIYKITTKNSDKIYVGSTCKKTLKKRLQTHESHYKLYLQDKFDFISSFDILKLGDYSIHLIQNVRVPTRTDLRIVEQFWIDYLPNTVNIQRAYISDEQLEVRDRENKQQYYQKNKELFHEKK